MELRRGENSKCFTGRVWITDEQWTFQEEGTGIHLAVEVNQDLTLHQKYQQCEDMLSKTIKAEHVKRKQAAATATKKEATKADVPRTPSDMTVKGKTGEGKLIYTLRTRPRPC